MANLLVVEDHALVREGLARTLRALADVERVAEVADGEAALALLEAGEDFDMVLLDLLLPRLTGFSVLAVLRKRFPALPVVVVSAVDDSANIERVMRHGVSGYVSKSQSTQDLAEAVRVVLAGGVYLPPGAAQAADRAREVPPRQRAALEIRDCLTAAQERVLDLLSQGKTNREIAELLGLSEGTVKAHVSAIFRCLKVTNRAQALLAVTRLVRKG
ncbi:MAG: response regulator transcription factor [Betaproteobacteria bacterium]|nr:response regulator transcription factor [Betaproteobacteria bacterium]